MLPELHKQLDEMVKVSGVELADLKLLGTSNPRAGGSITLLMGQLEASVIRVGMEEHNNAVGAREAANSASCTLGELLKMGQMMKKAP
jgi:hypothetical protein